VVGAGVQWETLVGDREIVRRLVVQLAEKRVLTDATFAEQPEYVNQSIVEIRGWLTAALTALDAKQEPARLVDQLRDVCNTYLTQAGRPSLEGMLEPKDVQALAELRESFRVKLAYMAGAGPIAEADRLARKIEKSLIPEKPATLWIPLPEEEDLPKPSRPALTPEQLHDAAAPDDHDFPADPPTSQYEKCRTPRLGA
jgi:hypothetical protein